MLGADEFVVVRYLKERIFGYYGYSFEEVPIASAHQRIQKGLALLTVEGRIDEDRDTRESRFVETIGDLAEGPGLTRAGTGT